MKRIRFFKMSACGNDFIILDNRKKLFAGNQVSEFVQRICQRRISLGADGVIFLDESQTADFCMRFYNADGGEVEMCGNGARCLARFAYLNEVCSNKMAFETKAGLVEADVIDHQVKLKMDYCLAPSPSLPLKVDGSERSVFFLIAGVPHVVCLLESSEDLETADVVGLGRKIRFHDYFQPEGTNANFVKVAGPRKIIIRTYERGVEDETLACGTGSIASSIICAYQGKVVSPVSVVTKSDCVLKVYFQKTEKGFEEIYFQGEARVIATGNLWPEELSLDFE